MIKKESTSKEGKELRIKFFLSKNRNILNISGIERRYGFSKGSLVRLRKGNSTYRNNSKIFALETSLISEFRKYKKEEDKRVRVLDFLSIHKEILSYSGIEREISFPSGTLYKTLTIDSRRLNERRVEELDALIIKSFNILAN